MKRITRFGISMDADLLAKFDARIGARGYATRSEAIRDLVREALIRDEWERSDRETIGTITIIYDHHQHDVQERLTHHQHEHHHQIISSMHVHLDHDNCLEVLAVKGNSEEIRSLADSIISTVGVKHGKLVMTSSGRDL
ncbi:nickel-responsive transcriptional regulator NikR [bacterium]|nr:nickel-responsive transcriptional regulator NikR [bacterium]